MGEVKIQKSESRNCIRRVPSYGELFNSIFSGFRISTGQKRDPDHSGVRLYVRVCRFTYDVLLRRKPSGIIKIIGT